ncbi:MAG: hypothetical protein PHS33_09200, partial [Candidatus Omnitrophica bacterium]|nr:hypothetical protein [Candidatus Omnitrophota bacterium]
PKRWNEPGTPTPGTTTPAGGTLVPSPDFLKYYNENEITRGADGKIYLKAGIPVRWTQGAGEVKTGENQANTAVDDLTNFDLGLNGINLAQNTPYAGIVDAFTKASAMLNKPVTEIQNKILETLTSQPKTVDILNTLKTQYGEQALIDEINKLNRTAQPLEDALNKLPSDIQSRYADIGLSEAQKNRRYALEAKPLADSINSISTKIKLTQDQLSYTKDTIKGMLDAVLDDQVKTNGTLIQALEFAKDNTAEQEKILEQQMNIAMSAIEDQIKAEQPDISIKNYTDETGNQIILGYDKNTGEEVWRQDLGKEYSKPRSSGGGGGGGSVNTSTPLPFDQWLKGELDKVSAGSPYGVGITDVKFTYDPEYQKQKYNEYTSQFYKGSLSSLQKLITTTDKQKMIAQGLNYDNAGDIMDYINGKYDEDSSSEGGDIF